MKKATGSGNFFRKFYSYDVNVKKNFSNFSTLIIVVSVVDVRIGEWLGVCGLVVVVWAGVVREVSGSGGGRGRRGGFGSGSEGRW